MILRPAHATGNRCGHDPDSPRLVVPDNPYQTDAKTDAFGHNRKSGWFYKVTDALNDSYRFPRMIPLIGIIYRNMEAHRQHRSEAREADIAVMSVLVHHMELASTNWGKGFSRVGKPTAKGFLYFDNKYWMKKTGLSASRLKRSFRRLKEANFIQRQRRWIERDHGKFKELATATYVNHSFFEAIQAMDGLRGAVEYASKKLRKEAAEMGSTLAKMLSCPVNFAEKQAAKILERKVKKGASPEDYPPSSREHWLCQLNKSQQGVFNHHYLMELADGRGADDPASLYRRAYKKVIGAS